MSRLIGLLGSLFAYFCVGTVLSQGLLVGYVAMQGTIDKPKVIDMLAVAHGLDLDPDSDIGGPGEVSKEQASLKESRQARAEVTRDIELRLQLLQSSKSELTRIKADLVGARKDFDRIKDAFFSRLDDEEAKAKDRAQIEVVNILQTSKPKQAKAQLMLMWNRDEKPRVVNLVMAMPERARKKVVAEFKNDEDEQTLSEILLLIGQGGSIVNLVEKTNVNLEDSGIRQE